MASPSEVHLVVGLASGRLWMHLVVHRLELFSREFGNVHHLRLGLGLTVLLAPGHRLDLVGASILSGKHIGGVSRANIGVVSASGLGVAWGVLVSVVDFERFEELGHGKCC